jgi:hypothetical protein
MFPRQRLNQQNLRNRKSAQQSQKAIPAARCNQKTKRKVYEHHERIQRVAVKGSVVDLAVGVMIGVVLGKVLISVVSDIIVPMEL